MPKILAIESSCDETAAAVVEDGRVVYSSVVSSQVDLHARFGGVVPELASRAHVELITEVIAEALVESGIELSAMGAVAACHGPGLAGALLVGVSAAKAISLAAGLPYVGVNHLEAHLYAAWLEEPDLEPPLAVLLVSGGHTMVVVMEGHGRYRVVGETVDDAAGEAFDKVAKLLGLGFPGGPAIERVGAAGNARAIAFPTAQMSDGAPDFSFSGIKTAVSLHVRRAGALDAGQVADIAASFQATVVRTLVRKTVRAARDLGIDRIVLTGGVAANTALREALARECAEQRWHLHIPSRRLCTDNAAMIAAAGHDRLEAGERAPLTMNAVPDLALA
jgi:N6-L-threonylcarbamoyladenine synthase